MVHIWVWRSRTFRKQIIICFEITVNLNVYNTVFCFVSMKLKSFSSYGLTKQHKRQLKLFITTVYTKIDFIRGIVWEGRRENERERENVIHVEIELSALTCETTCDLICYSFAWNIVTTQLFDITSNKYSMSSASPIILVCIIPKGIKNKSTSTRVWKMADNMAVIEAHQIISSVISSLLVWFLRK